MVLFHGGIPMTAPRSPVAQEGTVPIVAVWQPLRVPVEREVLGRPVSVPSSGRAGLPAHSRMAGDWRTSHSATTFDDGTMSTLRAPPLYITNIDCGLPLRRWSSIYQQDLLAYSSSPLPLYRRIFEGSS
jgi:hypothetical protein